MPKEELIVIVPYNPDWPQLFEAEKKLLQALIGDQVKGGIHHVGSTAVPGLSAKPIIDIMIGVKSLEESKDLIQILQQLEYCYYPYKPEEMHWFCKPSPYQRTHHLHIVEYDSSVWKKRLVFRDLLRSHPDQRDEYENLKIRMAEFYRDDREAYTEAKSELINRFVEKALAEQVA
jgi:GrpB-like predicted nucleotidyltransferase (UPF0157 family)